jgi:deazaflavin-dependent oxidoreductase (nitroreductase family)
MAVEVTPRETRRWEAPRLLRPLLGAMSRIQARLYRRMGDRMRVQGQPVLLLSTVGAKTGKLRQAVLRWFPDSHTSDSGQSWLIVASGADSLKHPAWFVNMARNPDRVLIEMEDARSRSSRSHCGARSALTPGSASPRWRQAIRPMRRGRIARSLSFACRPWREPMQASIVAAARRRRESQ